MCQVYPCKHGLGAHGAPARKRSGAEGSPRATEPGCGAPNAAAALGTPVWGGAPREMEEVLDARAFVTPFTVRAASRDCTGMSGGLHPRRRTARAFRTADTERRDWGRAEELSGDQGASRAHTSR